MDDINAILAQDEIRPGYTYNSPAHLVNWIKHQYGTAYWMEPGGIPLQTMLSVTVSSPTYKRLKNVNFYPIHQPHMQTVIGYGQAPTSGIYTGVEDNCHG